MRLSILIRLSMLILVLANQACSLPAQAVTPQVITVVVTAVPTATETSSPSPVPSVTSTETALPEATETATATPAPSPIPSDTPTVPPLPTVAVNSPPPPAIPEVSNLPAQGPQGGDIDFGVVMSSTYLMRIKAKKHGSTKDGDGIDHVLFLVNKKNGDRVYSNNETNAKYCIFMGGEPDCNPWPKSNGRYVWGSGGPAIASGTYQVTIQVALKSDPTNESQWTFPITIQLP